MLANKYRPRKFADLIGQEILVETIKSAISLDRVANAFLLTGSHGIGKTSSARIIAMAINCQNYAQEPCGECESCTAIKKSCHPDVLEIDAASHTGVDEIREIIDNACYLPVSARYRVYIIDEVHMLSNSAFNALLKLLEEPPAHIKFIFATTEKKKVPLTVISRCQNFALKRLTAESLSQHLLSILVKENVQAEQNAAKMVASFAGGSVRDALSLLDQVISYSQRSHAITAEEVKEIFGISDKTQLFDIMESLLAGRTEQALSLFKNLYESGDDPVLALQHILELLHLLIRLRLSANYESVEYSENLIKRATTLAPLLSLEFLNRAWQVLARGVAEINLTTNYYMAAEILLIRLSCLSSLPSPAEVIKNLQQNSPTPAKSEKKYDGPGSIKSPQEQNFSRSTTVINNDLSASSKAGAESKKDRECIDDPATSINSFSFNSFDGLISLCKEKNQMILSCYLRSNAKLINFREGFVELLADDAVAEDYIKSTLAKCLKKWTKKHWEVSVRRNVDDSNADSRFLLKFDIVRTIIDLFDCSVHDINLVGENGRC
ncbi:DNA polymerase III subunit gamma/tau [Rickettsiales bacterium]|nr:DNA polymerase III subunit gamma/tau [Rickettsiales bacterium]